MDGETGSGANPAFCTMSNGPFRGGVNCGKGVLLTTHPLSSEAFMEEYSYNSTHPLSNTWHLTGTHYLYMWMV
jgi:hypothetical protein